MNSATVTGTIATHPTSEHKHFMDQCEFDLEVETAGSRPTHPTPRDRSQRTRPPDPAPGSPRAARSPSPDSCKQNPSTSTSGTVMVVGLGAYEIDLIAPPAMPEPAPDAHLEAAYEDRYDVGEVD